MTDIVCKPLADHLTARKNNGLVDIKFYVHAESTASIPKVCAEAAALFDEIEAGKVEPFVFKDAPAMAAA